MDDPTNSVYIALAIIGSVLFCTVQWIRRLWSPPEQDHHPYAQVFCDDTAKDDANDKEGRTGASSRGNRDSESDNDVNDDEDIGISSADSTCTTGRDTCASAMAMEQQSSDGVELGEVIQGGESLPGHRGVSRSIELTRMQMGTSVPDPMEARGAPSGTNTDVLFGIGEGLDSRHEYAEDASGREACSDWKRYGR